MRDAMKCVIQRVRSASVKVGDELVSEIGTGLLILAAVEKGDSEKAMIDTAKKIRELRIFADDAGKMNRDVAEARGAILAVSQFTLAGSIAQRPPPQLRQRRGAGDARASSSINSFASWQRPASKCETGRFREMMIVTLENDGPVTFVWP